jgi:hypothetical protein
MISAPVLGCKLSPTPSASQFMLYAQDTQRAKL